MTRHRYHKGESASPPFTSSNSLVNTTNRSLASNGDVDDVQQGLQSNRSLTSSPLPIVRPSILCRRSSLFSTQVPTSVNRGSLHPIARSPTPVPLNQTYFSSTNSRSRAGHEHYLHRPHLPRQLRHRHGLVVGRARFWVFRGKYNSWSLITIRVRNMAERKRRRRSRNTD